MLIGLSSSHLWTRRAYWFGQVGTLTSSGVTAQITFQWQLISAFNLLAFEQTADFFINGYSALATSMVGVPCHHVKANGTESWVQAWIGHSPRKKTRWIHNGIEFVPGEESAEFIVRSCASTATNNTGACLCDQNWPSYKVELLLFDLCKYVHTLTFAICWFFYTLILLTGAGLLGKPAISSWVGAVTFSIAEDMAATGVASSVVGAATLCHFGQHGLAHHGLRGPVSIGIDQGHIMVGGLCWGRRDRVMDRGYS